MEENIILFLSFLMTFAFARTGRPIVVLHGVTNSCSHSDTNHLVRMLDQQLGVFVTCIESGADNDSWLLTIPQQIAKTCETIQKNPQLAGKDIDLVGLSQGNIISRGIIQQCSFGGSVRRYISVAGPQMGVDDVPKCIHGPVCSLVNSFARFGVYTSLAQRHLGPANYFKNVKRYQEYLKICMSLPDLNNERIQKNQTYKERFASLEALMLVMFLNDTVITPRESEWFGYYSQNLTVLDMRATDLYKQDFIGLRTLDESQRLIRVALPGDHLSHTDSDIINTFVPFLSAGKKA